MWRELSDKKNIDKGTNMVLICLHLISSQLLEQPVRFVKSDQPHGAPAYLAYTSKSNNNKGKAYTDVL